MTSALDQATALLDGRTAVNVHSVRAAAWVARSALEETLRSLMSAKGVEPGDANARTLLSCIEVLYLDEAPRAAAEAQYAWDALSQASHHHAHELSPTHGEVDVLIELVKELDTLSWAPLAL